MRVFKIEPDNGRLISFGEIRTQQQSVEEMRLQLLAQAAGLATAVKTAVARGQNLEM